MNLIFTAVVGRSGQNSLANILNNYGIGCFAEVEPPDLIYKGKGRFGSVINNFQRKWVVTHELLGRGKAKEWYEKGENEKLNKLAKTKLQRIKRLQNKFNFQTYIELSKFFFRTQCDHIYLNAPTISLIKLTRDPLLNARSFTNRNKDFYLDNVPPRYNQNCLRMNEEKLTKFQLYLWSWCEIELRYYRFLENHNVKKVYEVKTEDLNKKQKIIDLFSYFKIAHHEITRIDKINTNVQQGFPETIVTEKDVREYEAFINMIPGKQLYKIKYLADYDPYIHIR